MLSVTDMLASGPTIKAAPVNTRGKAKAARLASIVVFLLRHGEATTGQLLELVQVSHPRRLTEDLNQLITDSIIVRVAHGKYRLTPPRTTPKVV